MSVFIHLRVVNSFENIDFAAVNIPMPAFRAYQHAFLYQPRSGIAGSWNTHLCICPVFQMVLHLCQHLVVSFFVLLQNEGVYSYLFVVLFCFSLFARKVDSFFLFVVTRISPWVCEVGHFSIVLCIY